MTSASQLRSSAPYVTLSLLSSIREPNFKILQLFLCLISKSWIEAFHNVELSIIRNRYPLRLLHDVSIVNSDCIDIRHTPYKLRWLEGQNIT